MCKKKLIHLGLVSVFFLACAGFTNADTNGEEGGLNPDSFKNYQRVFKSVSIGACSTSAVKTYEDYRLITSIGSAQYQYIHNEMTVDQTSGLLYNKDGFIGAALGYGFGDIGSEYYFVLDTGIILPIVKVDSKAASATQNGCCASENSSVIEFVLDTDIAAGFFSGVNGYISDGNLDHYPAFNGHIIEIQKVQDEKIEDGVIYEDIVPVMALKGDEQLIDDPTKMRTGWDF